MNTNRETTPIVAYKGFDSNLQCRWFQYTVGQTFTHDGPVVLCKSGFHACENPLDVLNYYNLCGSRFALVEMSGKTSKNGDGDSKCCAETITIKAELKFPELIVAAVEWVTKACAGLADTAASGNRSQLAASGDGSQLAASGDGSQLAASGDGSKLAASGYRSQLAASGYRSQLAASGNSSQACAAGLHSRVKAGENGAMSLARWVNSEKRYRITVAYVGENGIKADTWYSLDGNGQFEEVQA